MEPDLPHSSAAPFWDGLANVTSSTYPEGAPNRKSRRQERPLPYGVTASAAPPIHSPTMEPSALSPYGFTNDEPDVPAEVVDAILVLRDIAGLILDYDADDRDLRATIFEQVPREEIEAACEVVDAYLVERGLRPGT